MEQAEMTYPASLDIDYSDKSNRLTVIFRLFLVIPILIVFILLLGGMNNQTCENGWNIVLPGAGIVFLPLLLMILFRKKYPRWWFDWNLALFRFGLRIFSYLMLLRDEYPSTDEEQAVHLDLKYPDAPVELNRWLPLVKWFLAIPHWVILCFLYIAIFVCTVIAWFAILFTATYPKGMFDFVVGVMRWSVRVEAYAFILTTDRYPPFSLKG